MHHSSTAPLRATRDAAPSGPRAPNINQDAASIDPALAADFADLVDKTVAAIRKGEAKPDAVFGDFAGLVSLARSVSFHEGKLLEWGLVRLAAENPDLIVMPRERPMPVVPAALEILERNGWSSLEGIRLRSEVHAKATYTPDLVIVDRRKHAALILDVKRSLSSYSEHRLEALRRKMMAVALIAADWLHVEGKAPPVSQVSIAVIDGSGQASDHAKGVFSISEIGALIGVDAAGAAIARLREMFAGRIRDELAAACRNALEAIGEYGCPDADDPCRAGTGAGRSGHVGGLDDINQDAGCDWSFDGGEDHVAWPGIRDRRVHGQAMRFGPAMRRIAVGFARVGDDS